MAFAYLKNLPAGYKGFPVDPSYADAAAANGLGEPAPTVVTPLTGTTVTMAAGVKNLWVNPAGTIAALTIKLPPSPRVGQTVEIGFKQVVTALTIQNSAAGAVASTAGAVGVAQQYRFIGSAWERWS